MRLKYASRAADSRGFFRFLLSYAHDKQVAYGVEFYKTRFDQYEGHHS
ncbi:hypothetical protein SAMN06265380_102337 [Ruegeria faecimaris]|uniref:Uncharacterized protein n=1 Tax=Ruegeria faecimaris TaxID=686389 RepID=A0A521CD22_9RHOB|nr:hypothetical protein SAMN06265380_102337 [Ruegeria faecimaris]